jgi:putative transposase
MTDTGCPTRPCCSCSATRARSSRLGISGSAAISWHGAGLRSRRNPRAGGIWRIASCRDYWSKYEFDAHVSPTANMHDAVTAVELAVAEAEQILGHPLIDDATVDLETGTIVPVVTIVTDNGGPFRSFNFEALITAHPELRHVRTRVRTPGQNGSRERGFGTMKYEWLFREEIDHGLELVEQINAYRAHYNHVRPHEAIARNQPADIHAGHTDPTIPNFEIEATPPTT